MKEAIFSIVAILNKHQKGELYFGVKNDGTVIEQAITDESLRKVSQAIGNHITPAIYPEIGIEKYGDRKCIFVKFSGAQRPYLAYNVPRIRVADEDLVMDQSTYDEMIRMRNNINYSWERKSSKYTIDDVDKAIFEDYLRRAKEAGRIEFADIRRFTGSILDLIKKAEQYIIDAMDWRVEIGEGLSRKEIPEIPLEAVREAIINSFGHKLFETGQSNEVAVFKNRIEIYSPGSFPDGVTPKVFIEGKSRPIRRNPLITRALYYSKDMESFATGLKRIQSACDEARCEVEFDKQPYGFAVVFHRKVAAVLGKNTQDNTQDKILRYCTEPRTKREIAEFLGYKSVKSILKYVTPLLENKLLFMTIPEKPNHRNQKYISKKV